MSTYFNPAVLTKYGYTATFNADLCELVTAVRKFEQTHTSASSPTPDCPSTGGGADTYLNKETK